MTVLIVYGSFKDVGDGDGVTNAPSPMMMELRVKRTAPRLEGDGAHIVTDEDIAQMWRISSTTDAGCLVAPTAHAVTNADWRDYGGMSDVRRIKPDGWRFPYGGKATDGLTVFQNGDFRPNVKTHFFPRPFDANLSLLPRLNWGLLPDGGESVFWYEHTPSNSLVLTWRNALYNRDASCPTNFQAELFPDGRFDYRYPDRTVRYAPVFPFDWDGDGLENSVDPDPFVANPIDANGANDEWRRIVCSNVFESVGVAASFRDDVNTNAYYFVDVCAERGPAPIYFSSDRASRLGSPVIVANGGETNHVPLLIGVEYVVTSTVPISVSFTDDGFTQVTQNDERSYVVKWPIAFHFAEGSPGQFMVSAVPYDPGVTYEWESTSNGDGPGGRTPLMSAPAASECHCWSGSGATVRFSCSDNCGCGGDCHAAGTASMENASFAVTGGVCRCSLPDDPHSDGSPSSPPDPLVGGIKIKFSNKAVIFEDEYRNTEDGPLVPRRSTITRLTISASGGMFGGYFSLALQNLDKLVLIDGVGSVSPVTSKVLAPYETYYVSFECEGVEASTREDDVIVEGTFIEAVTWRTETSPAGATVVLVELEAEKTPFANSCRNRHVFGVFEKVELKHRPSSAAISWEMSGGGMTSTSEEGYVGENWGGADWMLRCPLYAKGVGLKATCGGVEWPFDVTVLEPSGLRVESPSSADLDSFPDGSSGAGMHVVLYLLPETVDFQEISLQEIPVENVVPQNGGCFTNFPQIFQTHTFAAGAGRWRTPDELGRWARDHVSCEPIPRKNTPPGWQYLYLPWGWNKKVDYMIDEGTNLVLLEYEGGQPYTGGQCYKEVATRYDSMDRVLLEGTTSVNRYNLECTRMTNGVYFLNGNLVE